MYSDLKYQTKNINLSMIDAHYLGTEMSPK